jgi:hypothetical protein
MYSEFVNMILTGILIPIIPTLTGFGLAYLNKKKNELEARIDNDNLKKYIDIAEDAVESSVTSVAQVFVDAAKKDGKWTAQTKAEAFETSKQKAILIMGDSARKALSTAYGDFDMWLDSSIEYYVSQRKLQFEKTLVPANNKHIS